MHEWIDICNDVDSGQEMGKTLDNFCDLGMRAFVKFLYFLLWVNGCTHVITLIMDK
jgi:hypothetical protein